MNKLLYLLVLAVALCGISSPASAQVYGTWRSCPDGLWHFGNCNGPIVQQGQFAQQEVYQEQLLSPAAGLAGGLNKCEVVGALAGGTLGSFAKHHNTQAIILGAIGGLIVGDSVCTNNQGQRVLVMQQPQGFAVQPGAGSWQQPAPCAHDPGTKVGVLNLPGHPKHGQTVCARPGDVNISRWL